MGILDFFRTSSPSEQVQAPIVASGSPEVMAYSLDDPALIEFLRYGEEAITGQTVNVERALRNPSMFRAVSLISNAIGMLPTHVIDTTNKEKLPEHPLFRILHRKPNGWQSAFDFKSLMQLRALTKGDAYARIIRSLDVRTGRQRITQLVPMDPDQVTPIMNADWTVSYDYQPKHGARQHLRPDEVFHLRGLSMDGLRGISLVKQARDAVAVALAAELAAGRLFKNGVIGGTGLKHPTKMSDDAHRRLKESLAEHEGAENAGKTLIFEEGLDWAKAGTSSARDIQLVELRKLQVEEIARITGVPRPLLMVDETSWGSGIEALGQFFVAYALNPWFEAWQQAAERSLLTEEEQGSIAVKFNAGALLRGSLKDQADYLAKALGAGGHQPWMWADEARDTMDMPKRDTPPNTMMGHNGGPALDDKEPGNASA
ncbi:phage portal protein [Tianweitania sp.]|uniref:phage portal protein n=1 Tax=Tianweitania sp. TaxID=2021634 RepID=UPI00289EE556|nr:phage portal protein [Tianweitania sp.]